MSDFTDAIFENLALRSQLNNPNNQLRKVLDNTLGAWFDENGYNVFNFFINTATGKYLDLFGSDYGVYRQNDESDEDYRIRIVQEKLEHLTPFYLKKLYGLQLYQYISKFNVNNNTLTTDNEYIGDLKMAEASQDIQIILNKKFLLDNNLFFINDGMTDFIENAYGQNTINDDRGVYIQPNLKGWFRARSDIRKVHLNLPNAVNCEQMFCCGAGISEVYLNIPNAITLKNCFYYSIINFTKVIIRAENLQDYESIFGSNWDNMCENLEYIDITLPDNIVEGFTDYVLDLGLENLSTFIVNGTVVDL